MNTITNERPLPSPQDGERKGASLTSAAYSNFERLPRPGLALLEQELLEVLRTSSGLDQQRGYLGMSQLSRCPRELARSYKGKMFETDLSDTNQRNAIRGYMIEMRCKMLMATAGHLRTTPEAGFDTVGIWHSGSERELAANLPSAKGIRVLGHTDGETPWGDLVEIKSMHREKFEAAQKGRRVFRHHGQQIQAYMHFGQYERALVLYVDSGTFDTMYLTLAYDHSAGAAVERKARLVLEHLDAGTLPHCECGKCED